MVTAIIAYDISEDKLRLEVATYLEEQGYVRVQRSLFLGRRETPVWRELHSELARMMERCAELDNLFIMPIDNYSVEGLLQMGRPWDLPGALGERNSLFF